MEKCLEVATGTENKTTIKNSRQEVHLDASPTTLINIKRRTLKIVLLSDYYRFHTTFVFGQNTVLRHKLGIYFYRSI